MDGQGWWLASSRSGFKFYIRAGSQVFPDGTKSHQAEVGQCPVRRIVLKGDQGGKEVLHAKSLRTLEPGQPIFEDSNSMPSVITGPLHPAFPKDCWYLASQNQHWSNNLPEWVHGLTCHSIFPCPMGSKVSTQIDMV